MKIAYFDCFSGISGDMTLSAYVDLGVPINWLQEQLKALPLKGFQLSAPAVSINGIHARRLEITVQEQAHSRDYAQIKSLIESSGLDPAVKQNSLNIFKKIAVAESKIHNLSLDQVHFHEVGGLDSIIDIVGAALCRDYLGIQQIYASEIPLGTGSLTCSHGILPVPAPATVEILKDIPVYGTDIEMELVTPTGAAIVAAQAAAFGQMPAMKIQAAGYGAGQRELADKPNILRIIIGEAQSDTTQRQTDTLMIETCIDDMNPEIFGYLMEKLFVEGALDVYWIPIYMKKNRPGTMIQVLCNKFNKNNLVHVLLRETTTSGVRFYGVERETLKRDAVTIESEYGEVLVKKIIDPDGRINRVPEYEVCKQIALARDLPIRIVYNRILQACASHIDDDRLGSSSES